MPSVGFEHTMAVGERPQTYVLDREALGTGVITTVRSESRCALRLGYVDLAQYRSCR
jgi:hypothetical protein